MHQAKWNKKRQLLIQFMPFIYLLSLMVLGLELRVSAGGPLLQHFFDVVIRIESLVLMGAGLNLNPPTCSLPCDWDHRYAWLIN
jgi:hypothetical protein